MAGACRADAAGASMGATVPGSSLLIAGGAGTANRPGAGSTAADSAGDEVVDMVMPATTSTSAELATRAIAAPGVPTTSPVPRLAHRRAREGNTDRGTGAARGSPSWLSPLRGVTGWSVMAAVGGSEPVTGRKRSPACRVRGRVERIGELAKTRSPSLKSVHRLGPCRAGPVPPDDGFGFTGAEPPLQCHRPQASDQLRFVSGRLRCSHANRSISPCRYADEANTREKVWTR